MNINRANKTKILCTLGPATSSVESIRALIQKGMSGIRLNFSHGNYESYSEIYTNIHTACIEENTPLAILVDLQGPKIRIGELDQSEIILYANDQIEITIDEIKGNSKIVSSSYKKLIEDALVGERILIDDGLIKLKIIEKKITSLVCKIEEGGILKPKKGMNLPGMKLSTPSITDKDFRDLDFALNERVDYIALSFVQKAEDIIQLREWLKEKGTSKSIIAKIEKKEALNEFEKILDASDGIMIARGDLGVELPPQEVPVIQKNIIKRCNEVGKLVITATQMLESMIHNPVPTRAEASDVANAVWDGTDVVMLSGETSVGKYPTTAVQIMSDIVSNSEKNLPAKPSIQFELPKELDENLFDSVGKAISLMSDQINAAAIVVFTFHGRTARILSKYKPDSKIIAISNNFDTMNTLCLQRGVISLYMDEIDKEHLAIDKAKKIILDSGHVKKNDIVIFAAAAPYSEKSRTNWIKFETL